MFMDCQTIEVDYTASNIQHSLISACIGMSIHSYTTNSFIIGMHTVLMRTAWK